MAGMVCTTRDIRCINVGQLNNELIENMVTLLGQLWAAQLLCFPICCITKGSCVLDCRKSRARWTKEGKLLGFGDQNPEGDPQVSMGRPSCSPELPQLCELLLPWAPGSRRIHASSLPTLGENSSDSCWARISLLLLFCGSRLALGCRELCLQELGCSPAHEFIVPPHAELDGL